jgi:hypothetical protein
MRLAGATVGLLLALTAHAALTAPSECSGCHAKIAATYRRTGMARSFYRVAPDNTPPEASYYHAASERHFQIRRDNGRYIMRRWQQDEDGSIVNVLERSIEYVLGSGNHARSYVSRQGDGRLIALPLAWYADNGGYWPWRRDMTGPITRTCAARSASTACFAITATRKCRRAPMHSASLRSFTGEFPKALIASGATGQATRTSKPRVAERARSAYGQLSSTRAG